MNVISRLQSVEVSDEEYDRYMQELERLRFEASCNEASALEHAAGVEREKWEGVVADKDMTITEQAAEIARLRAMLDGK